mgnify:CR=1 FL=1
MLSIQRIGGEELSNLLEIEGLRVHFDTLDGPVEALNSVSFSVKEGEIMGVVGESGCGKSVTSLVTIGLASCEIDSGSVVFEGKQLVHQTPKSVQRKIEVSKRISSALLLATVLGLIWTLFEPILGIQAAVASLTLFVLTIVFILVQEIPRLSHESFLRSIRGNRISMIFQEPMTALNPLYTVEKQICEVMKEHGKVTEPEKKRAKRFIEALIYPVNLLYTSARDRPIVLALLTLVTGTIVALHLRGLASQYDLYAFLLLPSIPFATYVFSSYNLDKADITNPANQSSLILPKDVAYSTLPIAFAVPLIVFLLLWLPFSALISAALICAILAIPPIQASNYFQLDPAHRRQVIEILDEVRIPNPETVAKMYPHELSGGMRQRVMIAMMMACEPKLLIADEPTTALDVTIQAQILQLMRDLRDREGTSIMLITHDLGVIAEMCDSVTVMYAGRVVERAPILELFSNPRHAYTRGLISCTPSLSSSRKSTLPAIPGQVANPSDFVSGCRFCQRMGRTGETLSAPPDLNEISPGHWVDMCPICTDKGQDSWE